MTPPDRERRAREEMEAKCSISISCPCDECTTDRKRWMDCLDAYAEAVRQTERDRMARVVETEAVASAIAELDGIASRLMTSRRLNAGMSIRKALKALTTALAAPPEQETPR